MDLSIIAVVNSNKPAGEYVRLKAQADVNLGEYAVIDRTFGPTEKTSNEFRHIFAFPTKAVKKGEYVRLHTGSGDYEREVLTNGAVIHHFYWKSKSCVWNDKGGDVATLFRYSVIDSEVVPAV